jgi:NAD(P)-dependent dehydrogenase (short-subunit alcohol dehydrogenase family)
MMTGSIGQSGRSVQYFSWLGGADMTATKVALVTAGGSGMGATVARRLAADGYSVGVLSSSSTAGATIRITARSAGLESQKARG